MTVVYVMGATTSLLPVPKVHDTKRGNQDAVPGGIGRLSREMLILSCVGKYEKGIHQS